jgi:aldose 1-epimerase
MLGASLRHRGAEILRRVEDLEVAAVRGSTAGIPLLHPWANRLAGLRYRAAGKETTLDPASPLLHLDEHHLPMHGVPWSRLSWELTDATPESVSARLVWSRPDLLDLFPYPHELKMTATLDPEALTVETTLLAGRGLVPVSFGFHPYVGLPDVPRGEWTLRLPAMRRLLLDGNGIPTGTEAPFPAVAAPLDDRVYDDGFALLSTSASFSLDGGGRRVTVELLSGFGFAQVFAPKGKQFVALEPMTAPANALVSGSGLSVVEPGREWRSAFLIRVGDAS